MKTTIILLVACFMGAVAIGNAQTPRDTSGQAQIVQRDTAKQMNLLDEQTKMFSQIFEMAGANDAESPTRGADNYLDMINDLEVSEALKEQIGEIYNLYDTSLDPTRKEELKIKVDKMLNEAMDKGLIED